MKKSMAWAGAIALAVLTTTALAQPPGSPGGGRGPGGPGGGGPGGGGPGGGGPGGGGPGGGGFGQRAGGPGGQGARVMPPLVKALDADADGVISAEEIENASEALKTLDKNDDGQLTPDELRPADAGDPAYQP